MSGSSNRSSNFFLSFPREPFCRSFSLSNVNEEMKQQSSELAEQLKLKASESRALGLERDELRKRLEMADVMLQQVTRTIIYTKAYVFNGVVTVYVTPFHIYVQI